MTPSSVVIECRQTSGTPCSASSSSAPGLRSAVRLRRRPHWVSSPKVRLIAEVRRRIRCERRRSRSRIARSSSGGTQTAGTRSRRARSASTRASTRSVLQASGAIALTLRASAISIVQPHAASCSRTQTAPLIISMQPWTSGAEPERPAARGRPRRPRSCPRCSSPARGRARTSRAAGAPVDPEILHVSPPRVEAVALDSAESSARGGQTARSGRCRPS